MREEYRCVVTLDQNMDFNLARYNMVHQQVRIWDVFDPKVLHWMATIPREIFALKEFRHLAFTDSEIPIGHNQVMLAPRVVGRILQALKLEGQEKVLEVGSGTGYMSLLLSHLAKEVISLELIPELYDTAKTLLQPFKRTQLHFELGDASLGFSEQAPYDAIVLTGSLPYLPKTLQEQLKIQGRLVAVIGEPPIMSAILVTRLGQNDYKTASLFETSIPPLIHSLPVKHFSF